MNTIPSLPVPAGNPQLRSYLRLLRLPVTFSVWSNILAAHLIATAASPRFGLLPIELAIGTLLFWAGSTLNDCFDRERHSRAHPDRPMPSAPVPIRNAWALGFGLMALAIAVAALAGGLTLRVAAALAIGILAYVSFPKGGLISPLAMGACRYTTWMLGLSAAPAAAGLSPLALPVLLYTTAGTVLRDAGADGADGVRVRIFLALLLLTAVVLGGLVLSGRLPQPLALIPLLFALYPLIRGLRRMARDHGPEAARSLSHLMLLGTIPLDSVLLVGSGHWVLALVLLGLLIPMQLLRTRLGEP